MLIQKIYELSSIINEEHLFSKHLNKNETPTNCMRPTVERTLLETARYVKKRFPS